MESPLRLSFLLVVGIYLGYYFALSLLMSTAIPPPPFEINMSQPISLPMNVSEGKVTAEPDQTAKNTSVLKQYGVIIPESWKQGIGNQLFLYACSYALARDRNLPLLNFVQTGSSSRRFDTRERAFALDKLQVPLTNVINKNSINRSAITYVSDFQLLFRAYPLDRTLFQSRGICQAYYGFWAQYKKDIIPMFQLRPEVVRGFSQYVFDLGIDIDNAEESVAVHVRRGDFHKRSWDLPISYQRDSILKLSSMLAQRRKLNDSSSEQRPPTFFIFSDDIEYCKRELNKETEVHDLVFVSSSGTRTGNRTTSLEDFYLMMKCKHFIIPNSTFGWWAAFLGTHNSNGSSSNPESIVIASTHKPGFWRNDADKENLNFYQDVIEGFALFPKGWIIHTPSR